MEAEKDDTIAKVVNQLAISSIPASFHIKYLFTKMAAG